MSIYLDRHGIYQIEFFHGGRRYRRSSGRRIRAEAEQLEKIWKAQVRQIGQIARRPEPRPN